MNASVSETKDVDRVSFRERIKTQNGLWALIGTTAIIGSVGLAYLTRKSAEEGLTKREASITCAIEDIRESGKTRDALDDSAIIYSYLDNCINENDVRVAESVKDNMVDKTRERLFTEAIDPTS